MKRKGEVSLPYSSVIMVALCEILPSGVLSRGEEKTLTLKKQDLILFKRATSLLRREKYTLLT